MSQESRSRVIIDASEMINNLVILSTPEPHLSLKRLLRFHLYRQYSLASGMHYLSGEVERMRYKLILRSLEIHLSPLMSQVFETRGVRLAIDNVDYAHSGVDLFFDLIEADPGDYFRGECWWIPPDE